MLEKNELPKIDLRKKKVEDGTASFGASNGKTSNRGLKKE